MVQGKKLIHPALPKRQSVAETFVSEVSFNLSPDDENFMFSLSFEGQTVERQSVEETFVSEISFNLSPDDENFVFSLSFEGQFEDLEKKFVKYCFLTVVGCCLDELLMLTNVYGVFVEIFPITNLDYRTVEDRFAPARANYDEHRINAVYTDMHKLQKDLATIIYLIRSLIKEVRDTSTLFNVTTYMQNLEDMHEDEEKLIQELSEKKKLISYMRRAQVKEKDRSLSVSSTFNTTLKDAIRVYQDQREYSNEEVKFVKRWQYARHEQNRLRLKKKESDYYNTTINMQWEMELEKRCHKEFEEYIVESQKDYMDEIQNWMDQYETDLENRETDIFNLKMEVEQLIDKQEVMKAEYEERAQAIEQWLEYKRKKQEAEERMALETWAACKIQAWWRGVMVRKKLGPYRKHKGKKEKKRQGKAGKKK